MNVLKIIIICMMVSVPVAFGAFKYGQTVQFRPVQGEFHGGHVLEDSGHGTHGSHEPGARPAQSRDDAGRPSDHVEKDHVSLTRKQIFAMGVTVSKVDSGTIKTVIALPGEIVLNDDTQALVTPYVSGHVKEIRKRQGDPVKAGEVMAVLESRELADTASAYLANREKIMLAKKNFEREESLFKKKISPEIDYLEAKMNLSAARISLRTTRQKLTAMGLGKTAIDALPGRKDGALTRYEILSPINGQVLDKNLTLGEMVESSTGVYRVANMETVWVEISLLQKHLPYLKEGMTVFVKSVNPEQKAEGTLTYIGPVLGRETRTAMGRAELANGDGRWRPGLFVSVRIDAFHARLPLVVPKGAVQRIDGKTLVFVPEEKGFNARPVTTGQSDGNHIEIASGLSKGDAYVSEGAFELKAALITGSLDSHAGHGH